MGEEQVYTASGDLSEVLQAASAWAGALRKGVAIVKGKQAEEVADRIDAAATRLRGGEVEDFLGAGFVNRIPFDMYECIVGRGEGHDEERLRRWIIDHEDGIFDSVVGPAIDQLQRWYEEDTGDGTR